MTRLSILLCQVLRWVKFKRKSGSILLDNQHQGILDARALYPDASLADLYDPLTMPPELRKAHSRNDIAVMKAYGFSVKDTSEADCVAALMRMYQELTDAEKTGSQKK